MKLIIAILMNMMIILTPVIANADPDNRQDRRQERGRSDERQDKRECRQEEGVVGKDKRDCKQEEVRDGVRGNRGDDNDNGKNDNDND